MVKTVEEYPYSSAHHFLDKESTNKCLQNAWVTKSYQGDMEAIKAFLDSSVDTAQLQELKKASNLVEASNIDKKPDIKKLEKILSKAVDMKSRNRLIVQSYEKGYSQHMIAKVLGVSQAVIKRSRK